MSDFLRHQNNRYNQVYITASFGKCRLVVDLIMTMEEHREITEDKQVLNCCSRGESCKLCLVAIGILLLIAGGIGGYFLGKNPQLLVKDDRFCTMEAKLCPDGSYVGRVGPNCEFAECPKLQKQPTEILNTPESGNLESKTANWKEAAIIFEGGEKTYLIKYPSEYYLANNILTAYDPNIDPDVVGKAGFYDLGGKCDFMPANAIDTKDTELVSEENIEGGDLPIKKILRKATVASPDDLYYFEIGNNPGKLAAVCYADWRKEKTILIDILKTVKAR